MTTENKKDAVEALDVRNGSAIPAPHFATPEEQRRMLDRECIRLRAALAPFAEYAAKHGAMNLCGTNGAYLKAEAWVEAHAAFHDLPNEKVSASGDENQKPL